MKMIRLVFCIIVNTFKSFNFSSKIHSVSSLHDHTISYRRRYTQNNAAGAQGSTINA